MKVYAVHWKDVFGTEWIRLVNAYSRLEARMLLEQSLKDECKPYDEVLQAYENE